MCLILEADITEDEIMFKCGFNFILFFFLAQHLTRLRYCHISVYFLIGSLSFLEPTAQTLKIKPMHN